MRALLSLKRIREDKALTQAELAALAGISEDALRALENLKREARPTTTRKLAEALGVEPIELMVEEA